MKIIEDKHGRRIVNPTARTISGGTTDAEKDHTDNWNPVLTMYAGMSDDEIKEAIGRVRGVERAAHEADAVRSEAARMSE